MIPFVMRQLRKNMSLVSICTDYRQQIAISDVSGANYTEIIKDIDKIILVDSKGINRRLVIYASGNKRFVADIDLPQR